MTIARLQAGLSAETRRVLAEHGSLSVPEWRVLRVLGAGLASRSTAVRREAFIDKGQFSRTLDVLLEHGLIRTRPVTDDHRQSELGLTRRGRSVYTRIAAALDARHARFFGVLGDGERERLARTLDKLLEAVDGSPHP